MTAPTARDVAVPDSARNAVIALGSNLGDREATIRAAIAALDATPGVGVVAASGLVESYAIKVDGVDEQAPNYLNAVVLITTTLEPIELLDAVGEIEQKHGRVRETRWGDRTLDLDVVAIEGVQLDTERLTLPHPRAWERTFVLWPWLDVDPDAEIIGKGTVASLLAEAPDVVWPFAAEPLFEAVAR